MSVCLLISCLALAGLSITDPTDDLLRLEIEEAASDSRLLADELADMLARLEADESRQEAVEAAVEGDDIKVESALQEMLVKLENLEKVASEDSKTSELKGTLEEKLEKEEELRKTLETLETVAQEIKDVSSANDLQTADDVTQLLDSINDNIEAKTGSSSKEGDLQSALHLNGIEEMIRSLEKVTGDLQEMQDDITDYFNEDTDTEESSPAQASNQEKNNNSTTKILTEFFKNRNSTNESADSSEDEEETEQRSRNPKQLDIDAEYFDEFSDAEEEKSDVESNQSQKEPEEDCSEVEAKNRVKICLPRFRSVDQEVKLYSGQLEEVRHCYDV